MTTQVHFVYTIWSSDTDHPLYVGCTKNLQRRMREHAALSFWLAGVTYIAVETHPSREAALYAEGTRIYDLRPFHNRNSNPRFWRHEERSRPPTVRERKADALRLLVITRAEVERIVAEREPAA